MSTKKKILTIEQEIRTLVAKADAMRERADELLDLFAEQQRPPGVPGVSVRQLWEARSLIHCPILALKTAMKEASNAPQAF